MLDHTVGEIIAQLLVAAGLLKWNTDDSMTADDWQATYESLPDDHDLAVACGDVEGKREDDKRSMKTGEPTIFPGCAVQVRALDDHTARRKAAQLAAHLDGLTCRRVVMSDATAYRVQNFSRVYDPVFLMQEDRNDRRVWIFRGNVTLFKE